MDATALVTGTNFDAGTGDFSIGGGGSGFDPNQTAPVISPSNFTPGGVTYAFDGAASATSGSSSFLSDALETTTTGLAKVTSSAKSVLQNLTGSAASAVKVDASGSSSSSSWLMPFLLVLAAVAAFFAFTGKKGGRGKSIGFSLTRKRGVKLH